MKIIVDAYLNEISESKLSVEDSRDMVFKSLNTAMNQQNFRYHDLFKNAMQAMIPYSDVFKVIFFFLFYVER